MKDNSHIFDGQFGLERETLRVDQNGRMAQTPHPFQDDHLARDFCENQLEIITPVCRSIEEMLSALKELDSKAREVLSMGGETLWLYSNPPHIDNEREIPVARFEGPLSSKKNYRQNLERRYGKRLMLYSGIHFNFSFSEAYLRELHETQFGEEDYAAFKTNFYFCLLKQVNRYSWLIVFLTAASPVCDASFFSHDKEGISFDGYASMRNSRIGYWNQFVPELNYTHLNAYTESVRRYIQKGVLFSASELYLPVRLKPQGENSLSSLVQNGADHIELRMFDLNPLEPLGIAQKDLEFAHLLLVYRTTWDDFTFTPEMQAAAIACHKSAARYDAAETLIDGVPVKDAANAVLNDMERYFAGNEKAAGIIAYEKEKLSGRRVCEIVKEKAEEIYCRGVSRHV